MADDPWPSALGSRLNPDSLRPSPHTHALRPWLIPCAPHPFTFGAHGSLRTRPAPRPMLQAPAPARAHPQPQPQPQPQLQPQSPIRALMRYTGITRTSVDRHEPSWFRASKPKTPGPWRQFRAPLGLGARRRNSGGAARGNRKSHRTGRVRWLGLLSRAGPSRRPGGGYCLGGTFSIYWPSTLPAGEYWQTIRSLPLHCATAQPTWVVDFHTTWVKWPITPPVLVPWAKS